MSTKYQTKYAPFDTSRLAQILQQPPPSYLHSGDFSGHHPSWRGIDTDVPGRSLMNIVHQYDISIPNDGSPTYIRNAMTSSSLDVTVISSSHASMAARFAYIETHGSDHFSIYTKVIRFEVSRKSQIARPTHWSVYKVKMRNTNQAACSFAELIEAMTSAGLQSTIAYRMPVLCTSSGVAYKHLLALRRQTERKVIQTGLQEDITKPRNIQRRVGRHLDKLSKRWDTLCAKLDTRKPLPTRGQLYDVRSLRQGTHHLYQFRSIFLSRSVSELCITDAFCENKISNNSGSVKYRCTSAMACVPCDTAMGCMDIPFGIKELEIALVTCNSSSPLDPDSVRYASLRKLGEKVKELLLQCYSSSWESGSVSSQQKIYQVIPILKPEKSPLDISSYRPIDLSSSVGKIIEKMVHSRLQ